MTETIATAHEKTRKRGITPKKSCKERSDKVTDVTDYGNGDGPRNGDSRISDGS